MADDPLIEAVAEQLRRPVPLSARIEEGALARLHTPAPTARRKRPSLRSPLAGLAAAAAVAGIFTAGVLVGRRFPAGGPAGAAPADLVSAVPTVAPAPAPAAAAADTVDFVLRTSADSNVALVGDFNDWDPAATPLRQVGEGVWSVTLPLRPGRYRYTFIVDGTRWQRDPSSPPALELEDDFGAPTSVITVARR